MSRVTNEEARGMKERAINTQMTSVMLSSSPSRGVVHLLATNMLTLLADREALVAAAQRMAEEFHGCHQSSQTDTLQVCQWPACVENRAALGVK